MISSSCELLGRACGCEICSAPRMSVELQRTCVLPSPGQHRQSSGRVVARCSCTCCIAAEDLWLCLSLGAQKQVVKLLPCCFFEAADGAAMVTLYVDGPGCESSPLYSYSKTESSPCAFDSGQSGEVKCGVASHQPDEKKCTLKRHSQWLTCVGVDRAPVRLNPRAVGAVQNCQRCSTTGRVAGGRKWS